MFTAKRKKKQQTSNWGLARYSLHSHIKQNILTFQPSIPDNLLCDPRGDRKRCFLSFPTDLSLTPERGNTHLNTIYHFPVLHQTPRAAQAFPPHPEHLALVLERACQCFEHRRSILNLAFLCLLNAIWIQRRASSDTFPFPPACLILPATTSARLHTYLWR